MTEPEDHELILPESGGWSTRADGLRMRFWRRGDRIVSEHTIPDTYHGPPGMAHGGIVATLLDEISCAAAAWVFGWFAITGELTVRYQHPVPVETPLQWEARVTSTAHPRYLVIEATVQCAGKQLARSTSKSSSSPYPLERFNLLRFERQARGNRSMVRSERVSYRTGFVARLEEAARVPAMTIDAADLRDDVLALLDLHHLALGGTYGDPNAGDPIQYDELRIEHDRSDVGIVVYNPPSRLDVRAEAIRRLQGTATRARTARAGGRRSAGDSETPRAGQGRVS